MFLILTYDIDVEHDGEKRLRKVSKVCQNYGVRVQKSVFELQINAEELITFEANLQNIVDKDHDTIRIYNMGNSKRESRVTVIGKKNKIEISNDTTFIF